MKEKSMQGGLVPGMEGGGRLAEWAEPELQGAPGRQQTQVFRTQTSQHKTRCSEEMVCMFHFNLNTEGWERNLGKQYEKLSFTWLTLDGSE